jgi:hypothetical protein
VSISFEYWDGKQWMPFLPNGGSYYDGEQWVSTHISGKWTDQLDAAWIPIWTNCQRVLRFED